MIQSMFEGLAQDIIKKAKNDLALFNLQSSRVNIIKQMQAELKALKDAYSEVIGIDITDAQFTEALHLPKLN